MPNPRTGRSIIWNSLAWVLLAAVLGSNIYRAATQSITVDEAYTYQKFVSQPYAGMFEPFDANNHVLNSVLARLAVRKFGASELTLRLPSLVGGAIYLFAAYRLCFLLFGGALWSLIMTGLLVLNPGILDYLSAARGYSLSLGLLMLGMDQLIRAMRNPDSRSLYGAGICFGLSIGANLTALFTVAGVAIGYLAATATVRSLRIDKVWSEFMVPTILPAFVISAIPYSKAQPKDLYFGVKSISETAQSLVDLSFAHDKLGVQWLRSLRPALPFAQAVIPPVLYVVLALAIAAGMISLWKCARRAGVWSNGEDLYLIFFAISFGAYLGFLIASHRFFDILYPFRRTALYFIPLAFLSAGCLLYRFRRNWAVSGFAAASAALCVLSFGLESEVSYYAEWRFDAGTKRIVEFIRSRDTASKRLLIRTSEPMQPALEFYRVRHRLNWEPIDRTSPDQGGDFVVLAPGDEEIARKHGWPVIYKDPVADSVVAVPR